jgi:hypothetical protein
MNSSARPHRPGILDRSDGRPISCRIAEDEFKLSKGDPEEERTINYVRHNLTKCLSGIELGAKSPRKLAAKYLALLESGEDLSAF